MTMTAEEVEASVAAARGDGFLAVSKTASVDCVGAAIVCDMGRRPASEFGYGRGRNEPLNRPEGWFPLLFTTALLRKEGNAGKNLPEGWCRTRLSFATS